jgi:hypothetical protein
VASSREGAVGSVCARKGALWLLAPLLVALSPGCSVGEGEGAVSGRVSVAGCRTGDRYDLSPSAFFAQAVEDLLRIRVQRGGDLEIRSDGLAVLVSDASQLKREHLGADIDVAGDEPRVELSLYLNESCPAGRDRTPVVLSAVSGTIRFDAIYAPEVDDDEVQIKAEFRDVRFEDPRNEERWAELAGRFDFLYVRGSPAQRFP